MIGIKANQESYLLSDLILLQTRQVVVDSSTLRQLPRRIETSMQLFDKAFMKFCLAYTSKYPPNLTVLERIQYQFSMVVPIQFLSSKISLPCYEEEKAHHFKASW